MYLFIDLLIYMNVFFKYKYVYIYIYRIICNVCNSMYSVVKTNAINHRKT